MVPFKGYKVTFSSALLALAFFCFNSRSNAQVGTLSGWGMAICNVYSFNICPNQTITPFNYGFQNFVCTSTSTLEVSFNIMGPVWRVAKHNYTFTANTNGQISGFDQTNTLQSFTFAANQNINPCSYVTIGSNTFVTFSINNAPTSFSLNQNSFSISIVPVTFTGTTYSTCAATSTGVSISPNVPGNGGPWSYNWQPGNLSGNPVIVNPASTTIYTLTATTLVGNCANTTTVAVTTTNCCNTNALASSSTGCTPSGATTTLSLPSVTGFTPAPSYTWTGPGNFISNSQNVNFFNNNIYGTYTVQISNGSCNFSTTVTASPLSQFTPAATSTHVLCNGQNNGSANVTVIGGTSPFTYTWSSTPAQNTSLANNLSPGNFTCFVTDAKGCTYSISTQITEPSLLNLTISGSPTACVGNQVTLNGNAGGGTAPYSYNWTAGPTTSQYTITQGSAGNYSYSLTVTDAKGCTTNSSTSITFTSFAIPVSVNNVTICQGDVATFTATGAANYSWPGIEQTGSIVSIAANTNTHFTVIGYLSGCTNTATANVIVNQKPTLAITSNAKQACVPFCVSVTAQASASIAEYYWSVNGNAFPVGGASFVTCFNSEGSQSFELKAKGVNSCVGTSNTFTVNAFPKPNAEFSSLGHFITEDPYVQFTDMSNSDITQWYWDLGDGATSFDENPKHLYDVAGKYPVFLMVTNKFGCTDTVEHVVTSEEPPSIYIPNTFTPNEDHLNDVLQVKGIGIKTFHMEIFDRWGELIFTSDDIFHSWDGTIKGKLGKTDTYTWKLTYSSLEAKEKTLTGFVFLHN